MITEDKPLGIRDLIAKWPVDAYGKRYHIGCKVLHPGFGIGTAIGVARGSDGEVCIVCNFHPDRDTFGQEAARWRTWLIHAVDGAVVEFEKGESGGKSR